MTRGVPVESRNVTENSALKRSIRERMQVTGEKYTAARRAIVGGASQAERRVSSSAREPDYLPDYAVNWAREHGTAFSRIVEEALATGEWPARSQLQRKLIQGGEDIVLGEALEAFPKPLGFENSHPEQIVILIFGLALVPAADALLAAFASVLRLALDRYSSQAPTPMISRTDLEALDLTGSERRLLGDILLREAPCFPGGVGGPDDDWSREIGDGVLRYRTAHTIDDYLTIRAQELRPLPQLGFSPMSVTTEPPAPISADQLDGGSDLARDVFISHAGPDKDEVARPLTEALIVRGYTVWFDEYELGLGDSLSESIDRGLATSRFGIVILSRAFFERQWPRRELEGLVARETIGGERVILPVWHGVDEAFLISVSPVLADRVAVSTDEGIETIAGQVGQRLERRSSGRVPASARGGPTSSVVAENSAQLRVELLGRLSPLNPVAARELLRAERRVFERETFGLLQRGGDELDRDAEPERLEPIEAELWRITERRLATLLVLVEYDIGRLGEEVRALAALTTRTVPTRSSNAAWRQGHLWPIWLIVQALGVLAVTERHFRAVDCLWSANLPGDERRPLALVKQLGAVDLGRRLTQAAFPGLGLRHPLAGGWYLGFRLARSELVRAHYPELLGGPGDDEILGYLGHFGDWSYLLAALAGRYELQPNPAYWRAEQVDPSLPTLIQADVRLRAQLAEELFDWPDDDLGDLIRQWTHQSMPERR